MRHTPISRSLNSDSSLYRWRTRSFGRAARDDRCPDDRCEKKSKASHRYASHKRKAGGITSCSVPAVSCPVGKTTQLLLWPRLRRHHPVDPVIHHQISVVLPGMLNQPVSQIAHSVEPWSASVHGLVHSLVTSGLDQVGAVLHALLHTRNPVHFADDFQA